MFKICFKFIVVSFFILSVFPVVGEANYYTEMKKIDRKIYVAKTQQKMLQKRLISEKRKIFNGSRVRAYEQTIVKLQREENIYRRDKLIVQRKINNIQIQEDRKARNIPSIPGDIHIKVDRRAQTMRVYKGKVLIYSWRCSTGKSGYTTPSGNYNPYHAVKMHYSKKWNNAPMPYSVFYYKGFAIHGTNYVSRLGSRASHGCIRLSSRNAKKIYDLARKYGYKRMHIRVT